jgi:Malate synthase
MGSLEGVEVRGAFGVDHAGVLTLEALEFVAALQREFGSTREALLARRAERQAAFDAGELPDFLSETASVRERDWRVAPVPADLTDRRVEITLLPAQAGEPPGGAALERRLPAGPGPARDRTGHGQGDGAGRDDHRRLRDG